MDAEHAPRLLVAGAALDTANLGVTALGLSTVSALCNRGISVQLLDNGKGTGSLQLVSGDNRRSDLKRQGARYSRKLWRSDSLISMNYMSRTGLAGVHPRLRDWKQTHGLLDLSGGDSFSDIYGERRFRAVAATKQIASNLGLPVILLPQTYGPFSDPRLRYRAVQILRSMDQCWARDEHSLSQLKELVGDSFDSRRHRLGVDVAFALPAVTPDSHLHVLDWITDGDPVIGINVSGLVAAHGAGGSRLGGQDYLRAIADFASWAVSNNFRILLVPHVLGAGSESDVLACRQLASQIAGPAVERTRVLSGISDPREVKYIVSHLAWFTGARMHSTIASLSMCVPTVGTAYSDKFIGVFAACGARDLVVDLRRSSRAELTTRWKETLLTRDQIQQRLDASVPSIVRQADSQFDDIVAALLT